MFLFFSLIILKRLLVPSAFAFQNVRLSFHFFRHPWIMTEWGPFFIHTIIPWKRWIWKSRVKMKNWVLFICTACINWRSLEGTYHNKIYKRFSWIMSVSQNKTNLHKQTNTHTCTYIPTDTHQLCKQIF